MDFVMDEKLDKKEKRGESPALKTEAEKETQAVKTDYQKKAAEAEKKAEEIYQKWLYLNAELDNFKKRMQKEKIDLIRYGYEPFAKALLEVVDALENAMMHVKRNNQEASGVGEGIRLTLKQFLGVFGQFGIKPVKSLNEKFDPKFHHAVAEEETDTAESGIIIREHRKGYMFHDRLLRPADVVIAKQKKEKP